MDCEGDNEIIMHVQVSDNRTLDIAVVTKPSR